MERTAARKQMCSPVRGCLAQQLRPAYRMHTGDSSASRSEQTGVAPESSPLTVDEGIQAYLSRSELAPNTRRTYANGLGSWLAFLAEGRDGELDKPSLDELQESLLEDFRLHLSERGYSRFTVRTYMAALAGFIDYLLVHDLLPPTFSLEKARARLRYGRRGVPYPAPVPDPALPLILRYYDEQPLPNGDSAGERQSRLVLLRSRALVHTLYSTAGRIAEVQSLDRRDVADGRLSEVVVQGKGGKQRFIYLTRLAGKAIRDYVTARADTHPPLFVSHGRSHGRRLSKVSIWQTVKKAADALSMDVSPHDFRHFRARQMLDEGAPLEAIQEILGHSDISTTRKVYAIYSRQSVREIFSRTTLTPEEALANVDPESLAREEAPASGPASSRAGRPTAGRR